MNDPLFLKACDLQDQGKLEDALTLWETLITKIRKSVTSEDEDDSYLFTCLINLGECYSETEQYNKAIPIFEEALTLGTELKQPDLYIPTSELAWLYNATNQQEKAIQFYQKAILTANDEYAFYNNFHLGDIHVSINFQASIDYYNAALLIAEKTDDCEQIFIAIEKLVVSYQGREMYNAAIKSGEYGVQLLEHTPRMIDARLQLTSVYESAGYLEKATQQLDIIELAFNNEIPEEELWEYEVNYLNLRGNAALRNKDYKEAAEYFNQVFEFVGDDADLAGSFKYDIGSGYLNMEKYPEAEHYFKQAIELGEEACNEVLIFSAKGQLAALYYVLARYEEAIVIQEELLKKEKAIEDWSAYSTTINNLSNAYKQIGNLEKAQKLLAESGEIAKKLAPTDLLIYLGNKAAFHSFWGDNETSLVILKEALVIAKDADIIDQIPKIEQEIGLTYYLLGFYEEALKRLKAIEFNKFLTERPSKLISNYNTLGIVCSELNQEKEADAYFKKAVELVDEHDIKASLPTIYNNLGVLYLSSKKYDLAAPLLQKALSVDKELGQLSELSTDYHNVGLLFHDQKLYKKACLHFQESISIKEQLRSQATSQERLVYLDKEYNTYELLVDSLVRLNDENEAFRVLEQHKDRELLERMNFQPYRGINNIASLQKILPNDTSLVILSNSRTNSLLVFGLTNKHHEAHLISLESYFSKEFPGSSRLKSKGTNSDWFTQRGALIQENLKDFTFQSKRERTTSSEKLAALVHYYRKRLSRDPRLSSAKKEKLDKEIGAFFYQLVFQQIEALVSDKQKIIIVPDDLFGLLPFDTFVNAEGNYLGEKKELQYISSIGLARHYLGKRKQNIGENILAMGVQSYESENEYTKNSSIKKQNIRALMQNRTLATEVLYEELEMNSWQNLPFAEIELNTIKNVSSANVDLIQSKELTADGLKKMNSSQQLKSYRVLHFAVHAMTLPIFPEHSALILAKNKENKRSYFSFSDIEQLDLSNELTFLSACETALGKLYSGDGTISLTNAFFIAGSRMVISSLWAVHDEYTMLFVRQFYTLFEQHSVSKAFALTKQKCINGELGKELQKPVYWSAFVLWGI